MPPNQSNCPMSRAEIVDRYFLEHRAKLVDLAAFLDRIDRARDEGTGPEDYRVEALRRAAAELQSDRPDRARRVLERLSDPTTEPIDSAKGLKGAFGAYDGGASR